VAAGLDIDDLVPDPMTQFERWYAEALDRLGRAGLNFGWLELRRQVRVVGDVERTADAEVYLATR